MRKKAAPARRPVKKQLPRAKKQTKTSAKKAKSAKSAKKKAAPRKQKKAAHPEQNKKPAAPAKPRRRDRKLTDGAVLKADGTLELHVDMTDGMLAALWAQSALATGDFGAAVEHLGRALELDGPAANLYVTRGQAHYQLGAFEPAIKDFEAALALDPEYEDLHFEKGKAELRAQRHAHAEASFTRDLGTGEPSPISYFNRHAARKALGNLQGALADLDRAVEALSDSLPLRLARSELRSQLGDQVGALADLDLVIARQVDDIDLYDRRARLAFMNGDYARAASDFARATTLALSTQTRINPEWHAGAGLALGQLQRYDEGIIQLSAALAMQPNDAVFHSNRGWLHHLAGHASAALADLDRAIASNATYAKAFQNRAAVREKAGDRDGARADYHALEKLGFDVSESIARLK